MERILKMRHIGNGTERSKDTDLTIAKVSELLWSYDKNSGEL
jgi:hypothetical protein